MIHMGAAIRAMPDRAMPDTAPISFRLLRPPILGTLLIAHLNGRSIPVGYVRFTSKPVKLIEF
jgi:hypothetical protein